MEKEAFQKRLEDLGELAKINNNRLSTDAVKTFLKDMDLTEEQYDLVFAYLASKMITVEGYVPAADQKEGTPELSEEEQTFLTQYEEDLSYLKTVEEEALLELCREVEESGDNDAKARLTEQLLPRVVETAKHYAGRGDSRTPGRERIRSGLSERRDRKSSQRSAGGSADGEIRRRADCGSFK